jgi:FMN phosphatase YigB (HAD superfamily)
VISALTFDGWGALIDVKAGVRAYVAEVLSRPMPSRYQQTDARPTVSVDDWLREFWRRERELRTPFRARREHLVRAFDATMVHYGLEAFLDNGPGLARLYAEWAPRPGASSLLRRLARRYRLGLVLDADADTAAAALGNLAAPFSLVVTSEEVSAYKPDASLFTTALARLGLPPSDVAHLAADEELDLAPARAIGMRAAHISDDAGLRQSCEALIAGDQSVLDL